MKKVKLGIMFLALTLSMVLVSCGGTPEEKVQAYVELSLATPEMKDMVAGAEASGLQVDLVANGTTLDYTYTYVTNIDDLGGAELISANLEALMSDPTMVATQEEALALVKEECPEVTAITYKYCDNQGNVLASGEFK